MGRGVERDGGRKLITKRNEMNIGLGRKARIAIDAAPCQIECQTKGSHREMET